MADLVFDGTDMAWVDTPGPSEADQLRARIAELESPLSQGYAKRIADLEKELAHWKDCHGAAADLIVELRARMATLEDRLALMRHDRDRLTAENQQLKAGILDRERACGNLSSRLVGEEIANESLTAENQRLRADGERLDWLEKTSSYQHVIEITHMRDDRSKISVEVVCQLKREVELRGWQADLRSAIDTARGGK